MIIILEGPDGSGKSTLAEQLSKQTGFPVIHRAQPRTEEDKQKMMQEYIQLIRASKNVIFDRCWYSEMVYGPVMRDDHVVSYPQMYELERMLVKRGALLIYCKDKPEVLWQRATRRGEDYVTGYDKFVAICEAYDELMNVPHLIPVVKYDYKDL